MGGVKEEIEINGKKFWTLFDSGAKNTYVTEKIAKLLPTFDLKVEQPVALGGEIQKVKMYCNLECKIQGLPILTHARVLKKIGEDEDGKEIEVLIGALTMQEWGIRPIPDEERLDMTHYPKEFVEFLVDEQKIIQMFTR